MGKQKKPKMYTRFRYKIEDAQEAVQKIKNKEMSLNCASNHYNIPKSTLCLYVHKDVPIVRKMGPATVLSTSEELQLKNWILSKAKLGLPMQQEEVQIAVQKILKYSHRPNPFTNDKPGPKWMRLFLQRHPEIVKSNAEVISQAKAPVTEENIRRWFSKTLHHFKEENELDILSDPSRIYSLDEISIQLCPKTGKLIGAKNEQNYGLATGCKKLSITVICCYSADGQTINPLIIYPFLRISRDIQKEIPSDTAVGKSATGCITASIFYEYIANHFYKRLTEKNVEFPVALFFNGQKFHVSMELYNFCLEKKILLNCLFPRALHILQPCEVGIFESLKSEWKKIVRVYKEKSKKVITKVTFAPLFIKAHTNAAKFQTIIDAFKNTGLYPFDPENVDYSKCTSERHDIISELDALDDTDVEYVQPKIGNLYILSKIESYIPDDIRKIFIDAYESQTVPETEQLLFSIWKKFKDGDSTSDQMSEENINLFHSYYFSEHDYTL